MTRLAALGLMVPALFACTSQLDVVAVVRDGGAAADAAADTAATDATADADAEPASLFEDDFESCDYRRWSGVDGGATRIDEALSHLGRCSSRAGDRPELTSGHFAAFAPQDELWLRSWVHFDPATTLPASNRGAFLFSLGDDTAALEVLVAIFLDATAVGLAVANVGVPGAEDIEFPTDELPVDGAGSWRCYEVFVRLNTSGASDGRLELYVDGALRGGTSGALRGTSALQLSRLAHLPRIHGAGAWPASNIIHVDDVALATTRIGCE